MWVFTEVADWFDHTRRSNEAWLDQTLQQWVASQPNFDQPSARNIAVWTAAGLGYAVNKFSTTVAAGFVDVLRMGDGVQRGGWGWGEDALRLLMIAGPAVRLARWGVATVAAVDVTPTIGNCAWIQATRALRLTGIQHFARVSDLAEAAGLSSVAETGGASIQKIAGVLRGIGAELKMGTGVTSWEEVEALARENPNGVVMFPVKWARAAGGTAKHALLAVRNFLGTGITIVERNGSTFSSLEEYAQFRRVATVEVLTDAGVGVLQNSRIVTLMGTAPSLLNILGVEVRSVPVPIFVPQNQAPSQLDLTPWQWR